MSKKKSSKIKINSSLHHFSDPRVNASTQSDQVCRGTNRGGDDFTPRDSASPGRPPAPRRRRAQPQPEPAAGRRGSGAEGEGRRWTQRAGGPASGPGKGRRRPRERGHGLHPFPGEESVRAEHAIFGLGL